MIHAGISYISASTNRYGQAADISRSSCIAYGSSRLIAFWEAAGHQKGVFETLSGHEGFVTCVLFVHELILISGDDKGVLCFWRKTDEWDLGLKVQAHQNAISCLCAHNDCLATGSPDGVIKVWEVSDSEKLEQVQVIALGGIYPLSLAISSLPQSEAVILVCGGTDRNVHVWTRSEQSFAHVTALFGHEDWVKSLAFRSPISGDNALVLASGSQDATIRLWRIESLRTDCTKINSNELGSDGLLDVFEMFWNDPDPNESAGRVSLKPHTFRIRDAERSQQFSIIFDALLVGHEAGVTGLRWRPTIHSTESLLSTSTDSSIILWSPASVNEARNRSSCIWINRQRFGDIGGQRLGGFVGGLWAKEGQEALAWGWNGGWRRWRCDTQTNEIEERWREISAVTGHNGPVKGIDWSPEGEYLISVGLDQTTRIHGPVPDVGDAPPAWNELARPQVHGYNLHGVVFLDALRFVSIADEKVARVFEAPRGFLAVMEGLGIAQFGPEEHERPAAANVPPLGLSNKAIHKAEPQQTSSSGEVLVPPRPFEGDLAAATLWPEIEKIFGHGYELVTLAVSKSFRYIATACKATTAEHAVVRVYETGTWQPLGKPLQGHNLTITRVAFSPDDRYILSVSRDRTWRLFEARDNQKGYEPVAFDKSHSRIIWDCNWTHEGDIFATASRDKTVKIWKGCSDTAPRKWSNITTIKVTEAATALSFSAVDQHQRRYLAIGLESGDLVVYSNQMDTPSCWLPLINPDASKNRHVDQIHQLTWRPGSGHEMQLASCSEDGTLRIFNIHDQT